MLLKHLILVLSIDLIRSQIIPEKIKSCEEIITKPQFILESPKYPSNYPDNTTCLYVIKGSYCATNFTLQFLDFNVEDSLGCANDYLVIKDKDALCGNIQGIRKYQSQTGVLELKFVSNQDSNRRGFKILVTRDECVEKDDGTLNSTEANEVSGTVQPDVANPGEIKPVITSPGDVKPGILVDQPADSGNNEVTPNNNQDPLQSKGVLPHDHPNNDDSLHSDFPGADSLQPNDLLPGAVQPRKPSTIPSNSLQPCCAKIYNKKRFYLASKNFPANLDVDECKFTIQRANNNVCRLRLHFEYFNIGVQNFGCPSGYLQIDGKIICGCQTELKLISPFTGNSATTKTFVLKSFSPKINSQLQGFLIEVIQDECPKRYTPSLQQTHSDFYFYQDQNNRVAWPYNQINRDYNYWSFPQPRIIRHVYFFAVPDFYDIDRPNQPGLPNQPGRPNQTNRPRDIEETTYLDTPQLQDFTISETDVACRKWGLQDLNVLRSNDLWRNMERCDTPGVSNPVIKPTCVEFDFANGYFQSPYFPKKYEHNLNLCYRFKRQDGYCKLKIHMIYFDIEDSFNCRKDFLLLGNNFRYCGRSLAKSLTIFDMFNKNYHEVQFVSDDDVNGKGFKGIFKQLPCNEWEYPMVPVTPPPINPPTRPTPMIPCSKFIVNKFFSLDLVDEESNVCDYIIFKHDKEVCRLDLEIFEADLACNIEQIIINGQSFCGPLSGRKLSFDFERDSIKVSYTRMVFNDITGRSKPRINGYQVSDDCDTTFPPAQRILNPEHVFNQTTANLINSTVMVA